MKMKIDQYFLNEQCPFSGKRKFKMKSVKIAGGAVVALGIVFVLFVGGTPEKKDAEAQIDSHALDRVRAQSGVQSNTEGSVSIGGFGKGGYIGVGGSSSAVTNRQFTASQLIKQGEGANSGGRLPMGSTIALKLLNKIVSSDNNSPVIALVGEDVMWKNSVVVPEGTKAIGNASFDDTSRRLQIRFHTFVFPEGDQHAVSGLALLGDGSSGLTGDYHSGAFKKQAGRFLGNFVGGLAQGMKEKESSGQVGLTYEPGNLRNGILNGLADSSFDQAKSYSEGLENVRPYLEVESGVSFLLYLDREF